MQGDNKIANIKGKDLTVLRPVHSAWRKRQWLGLSLLVLFFLAIIPGCTKRYAYWNSPKPALTPPATSDDISHPKHASFEIKDNRGNQNVLVMLALSGGGSRAAYFSAEVMTKLQQDSDLDILKEVDVISSVSGGSLPAAYYAITADPEFIIPIPRCSLNCDVFTEPSKIACQKVGKKQQLVIGKLSPQEINMTQDTLHRALSGCSEKELSYINRLFQLSQINVSSNRIWMSKEQWNEQINKGGVNLDLRLRRDHVADLMSRDYIGRWIKNLFWPVNIGRYWFTAYDRSDIMAQTFEDNLFDTKNLGWALTFADLNPERPYLILNATDGTEAYETRDMHFGSVFTFTQEDFTKQLNSDIYQFDVARGVMASAAFPAVFNYATLKDFTNKDNERYHHVFDGGNADNLGLRSLSRVIEESDGKRYKHIIVILVDAFIEPSGKDSQDPDPRSTFSYIVDTNFMDGFDALLKGNRERGIETFLGNHKDLGNKLTFWHLTFTKIDETIEDIKPLTDDSRTYGSLRAGLNRISTDFRISDEGKARIEKAVKKLFEKDDACLKRIKTILSSDNPDNLSLSQGPEICK